MELLIDCWNGRLAHSLPAERDVQRNKRESRILRGRLGRLKMTAKTDNTQWETAIWFDTKLDTYLLPLKAEIRKKEKITTDKEIEIMIWI